MNPTCRRCGGTDVVWRGNDNGRRKFKCKRCGTWGRTEREKKREYTFTNYGETAEINANVTDRITNERDLIKALQIDTTQWRIERFTVGTSEGYRKNRQADLTWKDGRITEGEVHDNGELLIKTIYSVKVWLKRKTQEIRTQLAIDDIKKDLQQYVYKYKKIHYPRLPDGLMLEIEMPDVHLGQLAWFEESGENSDLKSQVARVKDVLLRILAYARNYPIEKIILPLGNDFYNSDNHNNTTAAGTAMSEDTRWQKTFRAGRVLAVEIIDLCSQIAPVQVLMVAGNHDLTRNFYLGDALQCWYHDNPNVQVDNSAHNHKYYLHGTTLIGLTHEQGKNGDLTHVMAEEVPELWVKSKVREWHVGHLHHKRDIFFKTFEDKGVTIRVLRSLAVTDAWSHSNNYIGALKASEAFLWSKTEGLVAQFSVMAKRNPD